MSSSVFFFFFFLTNIYPTLKISVVQQCAYDKNVTTESQLTNEIDIHSSKYFSLISRRSSKASYF